jgi:hypothetical protein
MKIEINTNVDSYETWQKVKKLIEALYLEHALPLVAKPGDKEHGCTKSRWNIL